MPKVGEVKQGKDLEYTGQKGSRKFSWRLCAICGKGQWIRLDGFRDICCVCSIKRNFRKWLATHNNQRGADNPGWKGGRRISKGYIEVLLNPTDPFFAMAKKNGYLGEHRLVVAERLGRCLERWEQVHHLDGNKQNNSGLNLVITTAHPLGYVEGYKQGHKDGMKVREAELIQQIKLIRLQLKLLHEEMQTTLFKEDKL